MAFSFYVLVWAAHAGSRVLPHALRLASQTVPPGGTPAVGKQECEALRELEICSHAGHGVAGCGAAPGSFLEGVQALWAGNEAAACPPVRCFDLDLSETADGEFLIGHPREWPQPVQQSMQALAPDNMTLLTAVRSLPLATIRGPSVGLADGANPTLSALLSVLNRSVGGTRRQTGREGLIALELKTRKDAATFTALLDYVAAATHNDSRIADMLALWHMPESADELHGLQQARSPHIKSIYGLPDMKHQGYAGPTEDHLGTAKRSNFTLVGPSIKLSSGFLSKIHADYDLGSFAWVVDAEQELRKAAASGLRYAVSNSPRDVHVLRNGLLDRCFSEYGDRLHWRSLQ